jgi:hypothetical protein
VAAKDRNINDVCFPHSDSPFMHSLMGPSKENKN